jgi:hypothetical protein
MKYQATSFADGVFTVVCPHCSNALAVDEAQLGQINGQLGGRYACPQGSCGKEIEFPSAEEAQEIMAGVGTPVPETGAVAPSAPASAGAVPPPPPQANPSAKPTPPPDDDASANKTVAPAAKAEEEEIVVGFGGGSTVTLEREAAGLHKLSVKTILHSDCVKDKKDTFDDEVSKFLSGLEQEDLIGMHPVQYALDDKKGTDFGVMIFFKSVPIED